MPSYAQDILPIKPDYTTQILQPKSMPLLIVVWGYCRKFSHIAKLIVFQIKSLLEYKGKYLPQDLSGQVLSGYDFTGCQFYKTNINGTNLVGAILTNTTCDYSKAFSYNQRASKKRNSYYKESLSHDLATIAKVYPRVTNNLYKAQLLHIACELARLPLYKDRTKVLLKELYWSLLLLNLKKILGKLGEELFSSLEEALKSEASSCCWPTHYRQNEIGLNPKEPHEDFDRYLTIFISGIGQYKSISSISLYNDFLEKYIIRNMEGLKTSYDSIKDKQLKKEATIIAWALSRSYQFVGWKLLYHYLFLQHKLLLLKEVLDKNLVKHHIVYYHTPPSDMYDLGHYKTNQ